jgi:plasmid stabilization system protein ParE
VSAYVLGRDAGLDLAAIWEFIAQDNVDAADRWIDKLFQAFDGLALNPGLGHKREDLTQRNILFWPVGAYLIVYRLQHGIVEIVAVAHGSRDIPTFLRAR